MIRQLVSKVPIDKIISESVCLRPSGYRYLRGIEHDSLVIDLEKNRFYWNSLGLSGDALTWLTQIVGVSYKEALVKLQEYSGLPFTNILEAIERPTPIYPKLLSVFYNLGKNYRQYWNSRGITNETLDYFKVGHTGKFHVVPVIVDNELVNFHCRGIDDSGNKSVWRWSKGRPPYPVNVDTKYNSKYVFLAEGFPDMMVLHQLGIPVISQDSGPQSWQREWNRHIVSYDEVYIIYDNDVAGVLGARRTAKKLLSKGYIMLWPMGFPDKFDVNKALLTFGEEKTKTLLYDVMVPMSTHSSVFPHEQWQVNAIRECTRKVAVKHGIETPRVF